jgi:hypothetical protein
MRNGNEYVVRPTASQENAIGELITDLGWSKAVSTGREVNGRLIVRASIGDFSAEFYIGKRGKIFETEFGA